MEEDIYQWFDNYWRNQKAEIAKAKLHWWDEPQHKDNDIFIYNK